MLAHKLVWDEVDNPFKLIAIHFSSEGFRLAFLLNKHLGLQLARTAKDKDHDVFTKSGKAAFALFTYSHSQQYCDYFLIENRSLINSRTTTTGTSLFGEESVELNSVVLLPQYRTVDFLLKIEEEMEAVPEKQLVEQINHIPGVSTAYAIDSDNLKYKENLIFD